MRGEGLVSVVITTKNEERVLPRLLRSIKKQTYKPIEIIVVDNNSIDKTKYIAREFTKNVFNFGPERSAQRNFGAKKARGKYLLFLDADMELPPTVLAECVEAANGRNVGAVAIPEHSVAHSYWEKVKALERSIYNEAGDPITDAARFFTRYAFEDVGGYDETITGPEDWDLPETVKESGFVTGRILTKLYHHERVTSPLSLARKKFYYGLGAHKYLKKHNVPTVGPKTVYFLRPIFYKNWKTLIGYPQLFFGLIIMFIFEMVGGGAGYLMGKFKRL